MPSLPLWTALPTNLDHLLDRMSNVSEFPVIEMGRSRCRMGLIADRAPDPHDWQLWRTGTFLAVYEGRPQQWPVFLRRCPGCLSVEVRRDGERATVESALTPRRRPLNRRTPGAADVLLGWYQGK